MAACGPDQLLLLGAELNSEMERQTARDTTEEYDLAPRFPELNRFLAFWSAKLEGPLYRVRVAHKALLGPADLRTVNGETSPAVLQTALAVARTFEAVLRA